MNDVTTGQTRLPQLRQLAEDDPARALEALGDAMRGAAPDPEVFRIAALAHRRMGRRDLAEQAEITAIEHSEDLPAALDMKRLLERREYSEASRAAALHLRDHPDDLLALSVSAETAIALGLPDQAIPLLEQVLTRAPAYLIARVLLVNALTLVDRLRDARVILDPTVRRVPNDPNLHEKLAQIATAQGDFALATEAYRAVTRLSPQSTDAWLNLGDTHRFAGDKAAAEEAYRKSIEIDPDCGRGWWSLADLDASLLGPADIARIEQAAKSEGGRPHKPVVTKFALGMALDRAGDYPRAFAHFARGNAIKRALEPYDAGDLTALVDRNLATFGAEHFGAAPPAPQGPVPVFVIGMPRAGSTLLERALGGHSRIEALGELPIAPHMAERLKTGLGGTDMAAAVAGLPERQLAGMGQWYLARAEELRKTDKPLFIDKLHMNWRHLPLILRMLPQARIIDIRRDAMACCWSNHRTLFSYGHGASNDLGDIAAFYRDYARQTDALAALVPQRVHQLRYEDLVEDFTGELGKVAAFLGVEFEAGMQDFHLSRAPVSTASSEQVRRPLNRDGLASWRNYAEWLGPLRDALGPLADRNAE